MCECGVEVSVKLKCQSNIKDETSLQKEAKWRRHGHICTNNGRVKGTVHGTSNIELVSGIRVCRIDDKVTDVSNNHPGIRREIDGGFKGGGI